jgi:hypothetical protein
MAWWIAGFLGLLVALFFHLYWRAMAETRQVVSLLVLVLLDPKARDAQRTALLDYITRSDAKNAGELGSAVNLAMPNHAMNINRGNTLGVAGILWQARAEALNGANAARS